MTKNSIHLGTLLAVVHGRLHWGETSAEFPATGVFNDSRKVIPGSVFVASRGTTTDGHDFLPKAAELGAAVLVVESRAKVPTSYKGAVLEVLDTKWVLASLLSRFYLSPEEKMISIGITGTNGKTSSSYIIEHLLNAANLPCGVMGTINHHFKTSVWPTGLTTPDTETFFSRASEFVHLGAQAFAMEVSSHSLHQKRVPIHFDVALFTNFSRDHLDYHKTMDEYFKSKELLFTEQLKAKGDVFAILNSDDPAVKKVKVAPQAQKITFGQKEADFLFQIQKISIDGSEFTITEFGKTTMSYVTPVIGEHNVYNVVGAVAVARALGVSAPVCQAAIKTFSGVPGRLQKVPAAKGPYVFVDYAHTPDALEKTIQTLRAVCTPEQKILVVFGCGGDRDPGKRPTMGAIAAQSADHVFVTSDNPRSEDPESILNQIIAGVLASEQHKVEKNIDRRKAIERSIAVASAGDVVLIAGKGHENYQILKDKTVDFDDALVAKEFLKH